MALRSVKASYIEFVALGIPPRKSTQLWNVVAKGGNGILGQVKWFSRWRKYTFFPMSNTAFEGTCMREISAFIEDRTKEHRAAKCN